MSETKVSFVTYFYGGNGSTTTDIKEYNATKSTWEVNESNASAIGLTQDGAIAISSLISFIDYDLAVMFEEDIKPSEYAEKNGFIVSNDTGAIEAVINAVVEGDPKSVADYKAGKEKALMALFGKAMRELKGNCNPQTLREILIKKIDTL